MKQVEQSSIVIILQEHLQLLQLILAFDLHLHDNINTMLLRDQQIGYLKEVVRRLHETHRGPFLCWYPRL